MKEINIGKTSSDISKIYINSKKELPEILTLRPLEYLLEDFKAKALPILEETKRILQYLNNKELLKLIWELEKNKNILSLIPITNITVIRHWEPLKKWNIKKWLSKKWQTQIKNIWISLINFLNTTISPTHIYYWNTERAKQSAKIIKNYISHKLEIILDERKELNSTDKNKQYSTLIAPYQWLKTEDFFFKLLYTLQENIILIVHKTNIWSILSSIQRRNATIKQQQTADINQKYTLLANPWEVWNINIMWNWYISDNKTFLIKENHFLNHLLLHFQNFLQIQKHLEITYNIYSHQGSEHSEILKQVLTIFTMFQKNEITLLTLQFLFNLYNYKYKIFYHLSNTSSIEIEKQINSLIKKDLNKQIETLINKLDYKKMDTILNEIYLLPTSISEYRQATIKKNKIKQILNNLVYQESEKIEKILYNHLSSLWKTIYKNPSKELENNPYLLNMEDIYWKNLYKKYLILQKYKTQFLN